MKNTPELLAPAGSLEKLKTAVFYGADAVYLAGDRYSLRAHATLTPDELQEAVDFAHNQAVKVYATVNIFAHNRDLGDLPDYLGFLHEIGMDGIIVSDPGILTIARTVTPDLPIHLSTQANVTNSAGALFWQNQGVARLNLARELSLTEISEVRSQVTIGLEAFVHGAICISYSGRCSLSLYLTGRNANQGDCAHPCRYRYNLVEEKRPGQYFPVEEDERGAYIFNSKDLCLLNRLPELLTAGINALKLEGRMKSVFYVGCVVRIYRTALDLILAGCSNSEWTEFAEILREELDKIGSRGYTENFIDGPPGTADMLHDSPRIAPTHAPVGVVRTAGAQPRILIKIPVRRGDRIEYLNRGIESRFHTVIDISDQDGLALDMARPGTEALFTTDPPANDWQPHGLLRKAD